MSDDKRMISTSILTATADAIRAKDGSAEPIKPSEFAEKIAAIPSGDSIEVSATQYSYIPRLNSSTDTLYNVTTEDSFLLPVEDIYVFSNGGLVSKLELGTYTLYRPDSNYVAFQFVYKLIGSQKYISISKYCLSSRNLSYTINQHDVVKIEIDPNKYQAMIYYNELYFKTGFIQTSETTSTTSASKFTGSSSHITLLQPFTYKYLHLVDLYFYKESTTNELLWSGLSNLA